MDCTKEIVVNLSRTDIQERDKINLLTWWLDDIFKHIKNVNETSLNESDRLQRLIDLEVKKGIPKKFLDKTMSLMKISLQEMSDILHVSERTLRRYDDKTILNTKQSERIVELTKLYQYGEEVLGDITKFNHWMDSKILAIGNKKPKEFLDTSIGINMLKNILGRIEHGVYS